MDTAAQVVGVGPSWGFSNQLMPEGPGRDHKGRAPLVRVPGR